MVVPLGMVANHLKLVQPGNPTMTSIEMVDFINEERRESAKRSGRNFPSIEFPSLRHDDFMRKVPKVLGGYPKTFGHPTNTLRTGKPTRFTVFRSAKPF